MSKSSVTEARNKLPWQAVEFLFKNASTHEGQWKEHAVHALDGTYLTLPNSVSIKKIFKKRKNDFYPRARLMCAFNVFTCQPTAATLDSLYSYEVSQAEKLLPDFKENDILLLDRGFHSIEFWRKIRDKKQHYVCRIRAGKLTKILSAARKKDVIIEHKGLKIRLIQKRNIFIATSLLDQKKYSRDELSELYKKRWVAETQLRRLKQDLVLQKFHSTSINGILQEVFAGLLMLSLVSGIVFQASSLIQSEKQINFAAATQICFRFLPDLIWSKSLGAIENLVKHIKLFIQSIRPNRSYPRFSKQSESKWIKARRKNNHVRKDHWKHSKRTH